MSRYPKLDQVGIDVLHGPYGSRLTEGAAFTLHGGALEAARRFFPAAPGPWLDLSTGINPIAYSVEGIPATAWERLPDVEALKALETAAALRYGAPGGAAIVAAPGTQALIQRLPQLCGGRDVRLLGPTYSEFQRVFRDADRMVRVVPRLDALTGADVAVVVNPNNPDGRTVPPRDLIALAGRVGSLIVDEAFADALPPSQSLVTRLPAHKSLVLRSFGKFYGLAGLRLGFAVLPNEPASVLRRMLGPWPVSGPALSIGTTALGDDTWHRRSAQRLASDMQRLEYMLRQTGAAPVGGTSLFRLVSHPAAAALFTSLARAGILVRPFDDEPRWLRFGLPGREPDWVRLQLALDAFR